MQVLVAFSHLRWDRTWQRPQHLLSRFAKRWPVIYVEEPVPNAPQEKLEVMQAAEGVQVWRAHVAGEAHGFADANMPALRRLVGGAMRERGFDDFWAWFHTPMALPLATELQPRGLVDDCMDELSLLTGARGRRGRRGGARGGGAGRGGAGGRAIHNAKRQRHPDVHCFSPAVDAAHFEKTVGEHPLHADIPHPRLGYCGVVDDRINLDLVDAIAKARPEWNIVMTGPVEKIDPSKLPRRDNIHWLGAQSWTDLPKFIKGWDVGLLPFALTDATRALSPAEPLEYMACGVPAVSTSLRDVVEPYGQLVRIADTPEGFIADCEMIMARTPQEKERHAGELFATAARMSWDDTAAAMIELVAQADELADGSDYMKSHPAPVELEPVPKYLASAAQL